MDDTGLDDTARLAAEQACISLINAYTHCADGLRERAGIVELFTEDGIWESDEARLEGREQMRRFFGDSATAAAEGRKSRHVSSNIAVEVTGPDEADRSQLLHALPPRRPEAPGPRPRRPAGDRRPVHRPLRPHRRRLAHRAPAGRRRLRPAQRAQGRGPVAGPVPAALASVAVAATRSATSPTTAASPATGGAWPSARPTATRASSCRDERPPGPARLDIGGVERARWRQRRGGPHEAGRRVPERRLPGGPGQGRRAGPGHRGHRLRRAGGVRPRGHGAPHRHPVRAHLPAADADPRGADDAVVRGGRHRAGEPVDRGAGAAPAPAGAGRQAAGDPRHAVGRPRPPRRRRRLAGGRVRRARRALQRAGPAHGRGDRAAAGLVARRAARLRRQALPGRGHRHGAEAAAGRLAADLDRRPLQGGAAPHRPAGRRLDGLGPHRRRLRARGGGRDPPPCRGRRP